MHRTSFGDARPANADELNEVFDEMDVDTTAGMSARLEEVMPDDEEQEVFHGWNAEISCTNSEGEDVTINTAGWKAGRDDLVQFLNGLDCDIDG